MIEIRNCEGFPELEACVQLQIETWGIEAGEVTPRKSFLLAQKIGGQVIGAFETRDQRSGVSHPNEQKSLVGGPDRDQLPAGELVGFAMAMPGIKSNRGAPRPYLHSHMLAVKEAWRNRGLGVQLKLEQRREALHRGIGLMEWTFDPLEIKNAYLNLRRLGAIVCEYREDFYGVSSSRRQSGLPTDRLLAEWHLDSPGVHTILSSGSRNSSAIEERIAVPASIYAWKAVEADRGKALEVLLKNRESFQSAFSRGLAVTGFSVDAEGNGVYELGVPPGA
jgi:predicted GNAT superfamily acetyltransferase